MGNVSKNIIIPNDLEWDSEYRQRLLAEERVNRRWFDRPAYYGTIAQPRGPQKEVDEDGTNE